MKRVVLQSAFYAWLLMLGIASLPCKADNSGHPTGGSEYWHGHHHPDVRDKNLVIKDNVELGHARISAVQEDIDVFLKDKTSISGLSSTATLYLWAAEGRTITFHIDHSLSFEDLFIVQFGPGMVQFIISDDKTVSFDLGNHEIGTQYWILMSEPGHDEYKDRVVKSDNAPLVSEIPTLRFIRENNISEENVWVRIGEASLISFIGSLDDFEELGNVVFAPHNLGNGRMVLDIQDTGGFIVAGHYTDNKEGGSITRQNIFKAIPAAGSPITTVSNAVLHEDSTPGDSFQAGLLVTNRNQTLFDLLIDPFFTLKTREDSLNFVGLFCGNRYGFVLGANSKLHCEPSTYFDYVALALNQTVEIISPWADSHIDPQQQLKQRNPSALFVDGSHNPNFVPAEVMCDDFSGLFFRSGVSNDGFIRGLNELYPFTINPLAITPGAGNIVLDVEGALSVIGDNAQGAAVELLSLFVQPRFGPLFYNQHQLNFPLRTFAEDEAGHAVIYNKGAFLINNSLFFKNASLIHTDENHKVLQNDDINSEAAYIGGETFVLDESGDTPRPSIFFENGDFLVHTSAAVTGVDLTVPNVVEEDIIGENNVSTFRFFNNGPSVDDGTGRNLIMGTLIGSFAADGTTIIDRDAHINVFQLYDFLEPAGDTQQLSLLTGENNTTIVPIVGDTSIPSIQTIYLGWDSNISIGTDANTTGFLHATFPTLFIGNNYFSIESRGGVVKDPAFSNITGQGGLFIDLNGRLVLDPTVIVNFGVDVVFSRNGEIHFLKGQAFFADRVGIARWNVDLSDPNQQILIPSGTTFSDFTFNWINTKKDFANFSPYAIGNITLCEAPAVTEENVTSLPTVEGTVDQFQIQGSRIGDPVMIKVDGGYIRELIFINNGEASAAPVGLFVLENNGRVGIGAAGQSTDSDFAQTMLGVNGLEFIANGSGVIELNGDMFVNNVFAFLKGPDFSETDALTIYAPVPVELRVKPEGILDFRQFGSLDNIRFAGQIQVTLEPGAVILLGDGTTVTFGDTAQLFFEPSPKAFDFFNAIPLGEIDNTLSPLAIVDATEPHNEFAALINYGEGLSNTDDFRVRIIGQGTIVFGDDSQANLPMGAIVGVETAELFECDIPLTDVTFRLTDGGQFHIGRTDPLQGGVLQIGNTTPREGHSVNFTLDMNGTASVFEIGSLGFLGLGVGVERPAYISTTETVRPNNMLVANLFNVGEIRIELTAGLLDHSRIYDGDDVRASLLAVNPLAMYNIFFAETGEESDELARIQPFSIHGGGNQVFVNAPGETAIAPIVRNRDMQNIVDEQGTLDPYRLIGVLASLQAMNNENAGDVDGEEFFENTKLVDMTTGERDNSVGRVDVAQAEPSFDDFENEFLRLAAILPDEETGEGSLIVRDIIYNVGGAGTEDSNRDDLVKDGAGFGLIAEVIEGDETRTTIAEIDPIVVG